MTSAIVTCKYIVADPLIYHGKWTFKGTRIMVWCVLEQLDGGMARDEIVGQWRGDVSLEAIDEVVSLDREELNRQARLYN